MIIFRKKHSPLMPSKKDLTTYKIIILGESYVGKTSIAQRFVNDEFDTSLFSTIGIDLLKKTVTVDGAKVRLNIWDTAGQERFHSITKSYYRCADGIILVFDLLDLKSFDSIDRWFEGIHRETDENVPIFLVGNKYDDAEHRVDFVLDVFEEKARSMNVEFFVTSAKTGLNIELLFTRMAEELSKNENVLGTPIDEDKFVLRAETKKKSWKKCC
ncbi:putative Ras small GTPase [Trachipleistophora hominis]|uniref:Putative Ras small GTPase n=1 Tax=Trachipleistophora hominis TaxID=72359 RepID=L7JXZ7_TRAHO|nr:putative Ras small GTPase [Trachipleistophora hominis]